MEKKKSSYSAQDVVCHFKDGVWLDAHCLFLVSEAILVTV